MAWFYTKSGSFLQHGRIVPQGLEKDSPQEVHDLYRDWAKNFWHTPFFAAIYAVEEFEEVISALTEYLPYQVEDMISLYSRKKGKRQIYRPAKAAKLLLPGRSELYYKGFAEKLIKPTPASMELTSNFREAYLAITSCMSKTEVTLRAVELYKSIPGLSCIVIKSDKGRIIGRALCNPIKRVYGEVYLHQLLDEDDDEIQSIFSGWTKDKNFLVGEKLPLVRTEKGILCPYLDTSSSCVAIMENHLLIVSGRGIETMADGLIVV